MVWSPVSLHGTVLVMYRCGGVGVALRSDVKTWWARCMRPLTRCWRCCSRGWPAIGRALLVVLTHGAVGLAGEDVRDLAGAAVWGLVRSAQAENPGRVVLIDADGSLDVGGVIGCGEPQLVVRAGGVHAARLAPAPPRTVLELPGASVWRLAAGEGGTLEDLVVAALPPDGIAPPGRCGWRWLRSGVNFRDVLVALGMYPGGAELGAEGAGVVVEVGPGVTGLAVGDAVMGFLGGAGPRRWSTERLVVGAGRDGRSTRPRVCRWCS